MENIPMAKPLSSKLPSDMPASHLLLAFAPPPSLDFPPHTPFPNPNPNPNPNPSSSSSTPNPFVLHANPAAAVANFPPTPSYWNPEQPHQLHFCKSVSNPEEGGGGGGGEAELCPPWGSTSDPNILKLHHESSAPLSFPLQSSAMDEGHAGSPLNRTATTSEQFHHHHHEDPRIFVSDQSSSFSDKSNCYYMAAKLEGNAGEGNGAMMASDHEVKKISSDGGGGAKKRWGEAGARARAREGGAERGAEGGKEMTMAIASLEDGSIGLRLGKRTYYEDVAVVSGGGGEGAVHAPAAMARGPVQARAREQAKNSSSSSSSNSTAAAAANGKKQRSSPSSSSSNSSSSAGPAGGAPPRCQAEGCGADLSGAKDYHRRHKVCEWHSKASKARVANLDQRFCQQCSRFHILSEFDEGKRSCRRRLAGHNERRRKPPQEPMSLLSPSFAFFPDGLRINALLDHPCFGLQRRPALLASSSSPSSPLMYNGHGASQLSLVMNTGLAHQQPSSEMTISGRALSLLSSTTTNSMASLMDLPSSVSVPMSGLGSMVSLSSSSHIPLQLEPNPILHLHHNHRAHAPTSAYAGITGDVMQPNAFHGFLGSSPEQIKNFNASNSISHGTSSCLDMVTHEGKAHSGAISKFEGQSMFSAVNNNNGGSHRQVVLDLMQVNPSSSPSPSPSPSSLSAVEAQPLQVQNMVPYSTDLQGLSIFGRQRGIM